MAKKNPVRVKNHNIGEKPTGNHGRSLRLKPSVNFGATKKSSRMWGKYQRLRAKETDINQIHVQNV